MPGTDLICPTCDAQIWLCDANAECWCNHAPGDVRPPTKMEPLLSVKPT